MNIRICAIVSALCLIAVPAGAWKYHGCDYLNFITHGTFYRVYTDDDEACWLFVDELDVGWEVVNNGSWKDGMTGTIYAQMLDPGEALCDIGDPVKVCTWDADYSRNVSGTLVFRNFIECPGYYIRAGGGDFPREYYIMNCVDFGSELCENGNLGRKIKAQVFVDTGVSICLGAYRSLVIDFDFIPPGK